MKILVGMDEGDFYAFDVSTFSKKKKTYLICSQDYYYEGEVKAPSFSKDIIDTLPEEMKGEARFKWHSYESQKETQDEYFEFRNKLEKATTDKELENIMVNARNQGLTQFGVEDRCEVLELRDLETEAE